MSDWTSGYVADIGYTFGYYGELNPLRVRLAFLNAGIVCPDIAVACELGFGQGLSANIHAAASSIAWHGTDFNPAQAAFAREIAQASGAAANLYDESFAEFCAREDLPDFDYIGLHGIWSWISLDNQKTIIEFLRRKLKVGGILYISYNTLPGWASMVPMRHLLTQHAEVMAAPGRGTVSRIDAALDFAGKFLATNPAYGRANPQIVERMKGVATQNRHYLAHEYFNRDWTPIHFAEMAEQLAPAKLTYACSAHYLSHVDGINLTAEQQAFLLDIPDAMFRESVRDFIINQQFRRDYWVKGARRLSRLEQAEGLRNQRVVLAVPRTNVSLKTVGALGEATLQDSIYAPIIDILADYKPKAVGEVERLLHSKGIAFSQMVQALLVLTGNGDVVAVQEDAAIGKAKGRTTKLNHYLMQKARGSGDISFLASPVSGGGVAVGRFQQLFLSALFQGRKTPSEWAEFVWQVLSAQGQSLARDGKTLSSAEENLAELVSQARQFAETQLPVLRALGVG
ncbi:MAG: methyltransferase [Telmatospirillum sp.]|nr:methyltransferase [Telmatospirillum sp.]